MMTDEQRKLVEDNHNLIYGFLNKNELENNDYYDIAAIGLCKAAMNYSPTKGEFSTLAYKCMENEAKIYWTYLNRKKFIPENLIISYDIPAVEDGSESCIDRLVADRHNMSNIIIENIAQSHFISLLDDKEKDIIKGFKCGLNQTQIAKELNLKQQMVSYYVKKIKRKWIDFNNK